MQPDRTEALFHTSSSLTLGCTVQEAHFHLSSHFARLHVCNMQQQQAVEQQAGGPTLLGMSAVKRLGALPSRQPGVSHSSCSAMTFLAAALPL